MVLLLLLCVRQIFLLFCLQFVKAGRRLNNINEILLHFSAFMALGCCRKYRQTPKLHKYYLYQHLAKLLAACIVFPISKTCCHQQFLLVLFIKKNFLLGVEGHIFLRNSLRTGRPSNCLAIE